MMDIFMKKIYNTMSLEKIKILQKQHKMFMGFIL